MRKSRTNGMVGNLQILYPQTRIVGYLDGSPTYATYEAIEDLDGDSASTILKSGSSSIVTRLRYPFSPSASLNLTDPLLVLVYEMEE